MKWIASFFIFSRLVAESKNMNGEYAVASGSRQNVNFNTDYASKGNEYFDVYSSEIATKYGDVYWHDQGVLPLPEDIVTRFAGKVIAITGYEQDQVMVVPTGEPGVNPQKDVSVPINWAYNHHYMAWMTGNYSTMKQVPTTPDDLWFNHGNTMKWLAIDLPHSKLRKDASIPTSHLFSEGNGGESRKSFHGYPTGYAQLLESPESWHITPMQVDTRNRACGATIDDLQKCVQFVPGAEPKQARYGRGIPKAGTNYSGLLECPCNSKFGGDPLFYGKDTKTKSMTHNYVTLQLPQCTTGETLLSATSCFDAVSNMGFLPTTKVINKTVSDASIPKGCTLSPQNDDILYAYYNSDAQSKATCSVDNTMSGAAESDVNIKVSLQVDTAATDITFTRSPAGDYCSYNRDHILATFPAASAAYTDAESALIKCESYCKTDDLCNVCSVDCSMSMKRTSGECQWVALRHCGGVLTYETPDNGKINGDISWKDQGSITITLSGPSQVWFGVGFNAEAMVDQPWTLIVNSTDVWEQKIGTCGSEGDHCPGTRLNKSIQLISNTVSNNVRTVVVQRSLIGANSNYYSFIPSEHGTINLITAVGQSQTFSYHAAHATTVLSLVMASGDTCVCDTGANGKLCEPDGSHCKQFVKWCVPASSSSLPDGDLLAQRNPTCNTRQYSGGLSCCRDGHNLLDADQPIPDELLRYHMKFRFWFQEYVAPNSTNGVASHYNLERIYQQTEANAGEYDIPPAFALDNLTVVGYPDWPTNEATPGTKCRGNCPDGADCECIHEIQYRWIQNPDNPMRLLYAGGHCHAPACISMVLYRNDTGEVLCEQIPQYGQGNVDKNKYDEAGYILIPPCLWGNDTGLNPSVLLPTRTPLLSIKKNRNTHMGHFGEMASWQMRGTFF